MKIFLVGAFWFGNWSDYCARALRRLGHEVRVFYWNNLGGLCEEILIKRLPYIPYVKRKVNEKWEVVVNKAFIKEALAFSPDLIFTLATCGNPLVAESLTIAKERTKARMIAWFGDDPFRFYHFIKGLPYYDHVFVADSVYLEQLKMMGNIPVGYLAGAADPNIFKPVTLSELEKQEYGCDIGFVGAAYYMDGGGVVRASVLESLADYQIKIYGDSGWGLIARDFPKLRGMIQGRILPAVETNKFFNTGKIILNIHHPQSKCGVSIRTFEIAAAGSFQLADKKKDMESLFEVGEELICYKTIDELRDLVKYYLACPEERKAIAQKARGRVLREHTYEHRMKQLMDSLRG